MVSSQSLKTSAPSPGWRTHHIKGENLATEQVSHTQHRPWCARRRTSPCVPSRSMPAPSPRHSTRRWALPPLQQPEKKAVQVLRENIPLFRSRTSLCCTTSLHCTTKYLHIITNAYMKKACSPHYSSEKYKLKPQEHTHWKG